ncbi:MAG: UDP-N-acetylmuramoyl-L-alanyl-D-glutamate--2,6-diaminopimelate ligase [Actinomycetota bacterium]|nr:UDP-N-acetylmuramoyl-L-alanyl-D-glutamate--2,6-diaminopimelate ligase [Actinomycetota bacterium]
MAHCRTATHRCHSREGSPAIRLEQLLAALGAPDTVGDVAGVEVTKISFDVAGVEPGALHCCLVGARTDGHDLADRAVERGAVALLCERPVECSVPQIVVGPGNARSAMALVAAELEGRPAESLLMLGVTGTNGKTSVTHLLRSVLERHGMPSLVVGTLGGSRTTPEAPVLHPLLASHLRSGGRAVAMEVSSHALAARRVDGICFDVAVFTNLSQDHLDFHGSMEAYFAAKATLFSPERCRHAVVNVDDSWGRRLVQVARGRGVPVDTFSLDDCTAAGSEWAGSGPVRHHVGGRSCADVVLGPRNASFTWYGERVTLAAAGRISVSNALAAAHAARIVGATPTEVADGLSAAGVVPGRLEPVEAGQQYTVLVDYAHTAEALQEAIFAARQHVGGGRVVVVFGCGGERDTGKRPVMGSVAARLSDLAIATSDNPRGEDPLAILADIRRGDPTGSLLVEPDREAAIALALRSARSGDVVLVAGKGHERYQSVGGVDLPFDDRAVIRRLLGAQGGGS